MTEATQRWASSYRLRLAVGYLLIVAVFAVAWAWSLFGPLTSAVVEQQQEHLQAVAQAGALVLADSDVDVEEVATRLVARTDLRLTVVAADGTVLADSDEDPSTMENHGGRAEIVAALEGDVGTDRRMSATQGTEQIYVAVPASYEGERVVAARRLPPRRGQRRRRTGSAHRAHPAGSRPRVRGPRRLPARASCG